MTIEIYAHQGATAGLDVRGYAGCDDYVTTCTPIDGNGFPDQPIGIDGYAEGSWTFHDAVATGGLANPDVWTEYWFHSGDGPPSYPVWNDAPYTRCDWRVPAAYPLPGCVFENFHPWLQYSRTRYPEFAAHVADAQALGMPGAPGSGGLNRLSNAALQTLNRNAACPSGVPHDPTESCDEYPFASTWQGAYLTGFYSARYIDDAENSLAGNDLGSFYYNERILDKGQPGVPGSGDDRYFVQIVP